MAERARYIDETGGVEMAHPSGFVAAVSVLYVQDQGLSMRMVSTPGSSEEAFAEQVNADGEMLCQCSLMSPCLWQFTGVGREGTHVTMCTIDLHEALAIMQDPDCMFEAEDGWTELSLKTTLQMVAPGETLATVFQEMHQSLAESGVPRETLGLDENPVSINEINDLDLDGLIDKLFESFDDDSEE